MVIDATNPERVNIPDFMTGMDWGYGEFEIIGAANYLIETGQATAAQLANAGYFGTLKDGVITFDAETILVFMGNYSDYANANGAFKVVLPSATDTDIAIIASESVNKSNVKAAQAFAESVNKINVNNGSFERESGDAVSFSSEKGQPVKVSKAPKAKKAFIAE